VELDFAAPADRLALIAGERTFTYGHLDAAIDALAARLPRGERVALVAPNSPAFVVALFAVWRAGSVAVPLSARLREYELARALADAGCAAVVAVAAHAGFSLRAVLEPLAAHCLFVDLDGRVEAEVRGEVSPAEVAPVAADVATMLYTSGTTGEPKGVLVRGASQAQSARDLAAILELEPEDRTALVIPASHAFGLACLLAALASGGVTILLDAGVSPALPVTEATVLHGSPAVFAGLPEVGSVRRGFVAGAPSPGGLIERLDDAGARILNLFGMTELGAASSCRLDDPSEIRYTTVGRPLPGFEFRSADGEIHVRGPHVTPGYHGRGSDAFLEDGWFRTGDLGEIGPDGRITIHGHAKEVIHVAGFSVFPAEVEGFLMTHPAVARAAVVGVPHPRRGSALRAFVVARPGHAVEPAELLRFARPRIAGYKLPYDIEVIDEMPLLASGKPDRAALREA
jgi:acyl-CoA synthetase (AMP-forming)/AMP-acid ligase II